MRVSLNLIKKYVDLSDISDEKIATDLTLKTVLSREWNYLDYGIHCHIR